MYNAQSILLKIADKLKRNDIMQIIVKPGEMSGQIRIHEEKSAYQIKWLYDRQLIRLLSTKLDYQPQWTKIYIENEKEISIFDKIKSALINENLNSLGEDDIIQEEKKIKKSRTDLIKEACAIYEVLVEQDIITKKDIMHYIKYNFDKKNVVHLNIEQLNKMIYDLSKNIEFFKDRLEELEQEEQEEKDNQDIEKKGLKEQIKEQEELMVT